MKTYDKPTIYMDSEGDIPCYIHAVSAKTVYDFYDTPEVTSVRQFKMFLFANSKQPLIFVSFAGEELDHSLVKEVVKSSCLLKVTGINPNTKNKYVMMLFKNPKFSVKRVR